ncbi:FlgO family outer membrane protein [Photobacterium leiognathi]|uniref:FlgO family outer membrane protein n=1 Tax=Photobacterium leiognathi TaxID=553611 RepID=UPI0027352417|nr:FlgO family outer membrane protein [Photobacterium leiognathi]
MKKWIVIVLSLALTACATPPVYNGKERYSSGTYSLTDTPRHTVDYFVEGLANQLVTSNQYLTASTPLAVTSFVDLQDMTETNWLGNVVSENFMYQMQQRGFTVVDYKSTGVIKVTSDGDFSISRNWRELASQQPVDYVLTGTMLRQSGGVLVNARIIGMRSNVVIATALGFLPAERIGRDLDFMNKIQLRNGVIMRSEVRNRPDNNVILKP